jgi:hypothetical protein
MKQGLYWMSLGTMAVLLAGCSAAPEKAATPAPAPSQPEFRGMVTINDVMVSVVDHNAHIIWNAADPKRKPKTDADWHVLEHAATTLAASGNMILIPGAPKDDHEWVKDPEWRKYAQDLADAGAYALQAVDSRNQAGVEKAGDDLVVTCEACHKKFKPAIPAHVAKPSEQPEHYHKDEKGK